MARPFSSPAPFDEMPTDWSRGLAVVAHPDDLEYGVASAIAAWTSVGKSFVYLLASRGEAGIDSMPPERAALVREAEQRASARIVGVNTVEFLSYPDGLIEYSVALRRDIAAVIRRHRPDMVVTMNHHESFPHGGDNMADHRNVGRAALDAVRDAGNRWLFPEMVAAGLEPWSGVRYAAIAASPYSTHAVDVSATLDRGVSSLLAHQAYLEGLGDNPLRDAEGFLRSVAEATGARFDDRPAVAFELLEM